MVFKFVALFALAVAVNAGVQPAYQAFDKQQTVLKQVEYQAPTPYEFSYEVADKYTGDFKSQKESSDGAKVVGQYMLIDADGYRRVVDYTADDYSGFNAVVRREPVGKEYVQAYAAPVAAIASPVVAKAYSPLAYQHSGVPSYEVKEKLFTPASDYNPVRRDVSASKYYPSQKLTQVAYTPAQKTAYDSDRSSGLSSNYKY